MADIRTVLFPLIFGSIGFYLLTLRQPGRQAFSALSKQYVASHKERTVAAVGAVLFCLSLWHVISLEVSAGNVLFPSPAATMWAALRLMRSGVLWEEARISIARVFVGFLAATIVGVTAGLLAGSFVLGRRIVLPPNTFLRYVPPTAFASLLIVYFGIGEEYKYSVIFLGVIFFIVQMVIDVVEDMDARYLEIGMTSGLSVKSIFSTIILRGSLPRIVDVLRINLSAAWTFLVVAELVAADRGLGHLIAVSQRFLRVDDLYVGIIAFGVIGLVTDFSISFAARKLLPWHSLTTR